MADFDESGFHNPALRDKLNRRKAEDRLFQGSFLPKPVDEVVAYIEDVYGVSEETARHDIFVKTKRKFVIIENGVLKSLLPPSHSQGEDSERN